MADREFQAFRPLVNSIRVRAATTANITISTALNAGDTLDGVTLADGMLVLVKDQTSAAENGIYVVGTVPRRYADFSGDIRGAAGAFDMHPGIFIIVEDGTANQKSGWVCTSSRSGTLGSSDIVFGQAIETTLEQFGGTGQGTNTTADTLALQRAMAIAGNIVDGRGKEYYITQGVSCAARTVLRNARLKVKLGTGGFASKETLTGRYDTDHCLLSWEDVDGGGYDNIEIYGDGGGEYVCMPIAIRGGMSTKPFIGKGVCYIHDLAGITGLFTLTDFGEAGVFLDTVYMRDIGITKDGISWFTRNNLAYGAVPLQVTGFHQVNDDGEATGRVRIKKLIGYDFFQTGEAWVDPNGRGQVDMVTFGGSKYIGPQIDYIYGEAIDGDLLDMFCDGAQIGTIVGKNIHFAFAKMVHGARNNTFERIHSLGGVGRHICVFGGSNTADSTVQNNTVKSITGVFTTDTMNSGTLVSATATTAVLAVGASSINDYYFESGGGGRIRLLTGTGAPSEVAITDYVGSTRTVSVAAWLSGTPDNTTTYEIVWFGDRCVVAFENVGTQGAVNNHATVDGVLNSGGMDYILRTNMTGAATYNNTVTINKDMGFDDQSVDYGSGTTRPVKVFVGTPAKAYTRLGITSAQTIAAAGTPTTINFDVIRDDSYDLNASTDLQADTANLGIRPRLPGLKFFEIQLTSSLLVANETVSIYLMRDGVTLRQKVFEVPNTTGSHAFAFTGQVLHDISTTDVATDENLYTVMWEQSTAANQTISNTATRTWFAMGDS